MAIYGQNYGQNLAKFLAIILVTPTTLHYKKIHLEILHIPSLAAYQTELVVQFYGHVNPFHPNVAVKTDNCPTTTPCANEEKQGA